MLLDEPQEKDDERTFFRLEGCNDVRMYGCMDVLIYQCRNVRIPQVLPQQVAAGHGVRLVY